MAPILGYWGIRGMGQPMRLLLHYVGEEFEDKKYSYDNKDEWFGVKYTFGFPFPNLPYLIDGDIKMTQSLAILRYLGRKYKLTAKTEEEQIRIDVLEQQLIDILNGFIKASFAGDFPKAKEEYVKNMPTVLKSVSEFLGERPYFAGNDITYVDFLAYYMFDVFKVIAPKIIGEFKNLTKFLSKIESNPNVAKFLSSPDNVNLSFDFVLKWVNE